MGTPRLKFPAAVVSAGLLVLLAACSGETPASTERVESAPKATQAEETTDPAADESTAEVTVDGVGFVVDDDVAVPYATITNPTEDVVMASVNFAAYDDAGTVVGTASGGPVLVRSGDAQQVTGWVDVPAGTAVAKVTGQVEVLDSEPDPRPESLMTPGQVNITADDFGWITVTGVIDSAYEQSVTEPIVHAVCTDDAGAVVAAGFTFVSGTVVPGTPAPFEMRLDGTVPTACNITASVSMLSEGE